MCVVYVSFFPKGDKRQHSYAEKETSPVSPRDGVSKKGTDKRECTDYFSKKKFWQSFESTTTTNIVGSESKLAAPIPKPRASICTSRLIDLPDTTTIPPTASRRSSEHISRLSVTPVNQDKVINKSESEGNALFVAGAEEDSTRTKPNIRQMHYLTSCSTDSEAEYLASFGVEKLAYENMAFSEEDENQAIAEEPATDSGNVKAKKIFFEQQIHSSLEDNSVYSLKDAAGVNIHIDKLPRVSQHFEEHLDKSEVESSEKKKQSSVEDIEDPSTATPIDILLTNGCSVEGSADSTRSESDFTPEELRSVSDLSIEVVSESVDLKFLPKSDTNQSASAVSKGSEADGPINADIKQTSQKVDPSTTPFGKSLSPKESTQPETSKSSIFSDDNTQKTESTCQKPYIDELIFDEKMKSSVSIGKSTFEMKMPANELMQDDSHGKIKESFTPALSKITCSNESSSKDTAKKISSESREKALIDEKKKDLVKQQTDERIEMKLESTTDPLNDVTKDTVDNTSKKISVSTSSSNEISIITVTSAEKSVPQNILEKSAGLESHSLTNIQESERPIINDVKIENTAVNSKNIDEGRGKEIKDDRINNSSLISTPQSKICEMPQKIEKVVTIHENVGILQGTDKGSVMNIVTTIEETDDGEPRQKTSTIEDVKIPIDLKVDKTPAYSETVSEKKSVQEDSKKYIDLPLNAEEIKITKEFTEKHNIDTALTDKIMISNDSEKQLTSTMKKSTSSEDSQTILEKVITSNIPVSSVITTKRITVSDSSNTDSFNISSSQKAQSIEETTLFLSDDKYSKIPSKSGKIALEEVPKQGSSEKVSDALQGPEAVVTVENKEPVELPASKVFKSINIEKSHETLTPVITTTESIAEKKPSSEHDETVITSEITGKSIVIEKVGDVNSKIPKLPSTETIKTSIISSEKSGGFAETKTIQEKIILAPSSAITEPVTSSTKAKHTVDEYPMQVSKETTVITSFTSGTTGEQSFLIEENMPSSIPTDSSINITKNEERIPIECEVKYQEIVRTLEEGVVISATSSDTSVAIQPAEEMTANSGQPTSEPSELITSINQLEKSTPIISKLNELSLSDVKKPLISPIKSQQLSEVKSEKCSDDCSDKKKTEDDSRESCEAVIKEDTSASVSKIPKRGSVSKIESVSTSGLDEVITSAESKTYLKDSKAGTVKKSQIPVRKMISREKSNESINFPKASVKVSTFSDEHLDSNMISNDSIQSETKSIEKNKENVTEKLPCKLDDTESQIKSNLNVVVIPKGDEYTASSIAQPSKSSPPAEHESKAHSSLVDCEKVESVNHQHSKFPRDSELGDIPIDIKVSDKPLLSSSSVHEDNSSHEGDDISDEQIVTFGHSDKRISISEEEAKVAADNLIDEIETELNQRPDLVENLLLSQMDLLCHDTNNAVADDSNDITDEDLRSTGTEVDIAMPEYSDYSKYANNACEDSSKSAEIKISEASPTEYEINYEQVEEFSLPESSDFEERIIPEEEELDKEGWKDSSFGLENRLEHTAAKPPIPDSNKKPPTPSTISAIRRKSSEESTPRTDILSPESGSSDTASKRYEDATSSPSLVVITRAKKPHEIDLCSSSSESHYHSFTSRPCSSDIEGMLSLSAVPGSSEYETAASRDTSSYSHEFHTAVSSASIHDSLKSIDSESSGHLGSAEVSSEMSETLVPSSGELEHDIDYPGGINVLLDDTPRNIYSKTFLEPYDQDIPMNVIKGTAQTDSTKLRQTINKSDAFYNPLLDERLESSCEDMSSLSTTDGGTNVPTVVEVTSAESDRMDSSLISEQTSLTMSAISNQLSTSSSDFKDEVETERKTVDTNTLSISHPPPVGPGSTTNVTLLTSISEDQGRHNVNTQITSSFEPAKVDCSKSTDISPDSESFELIEKPDLLDDFVVIEEVAKEACELDTEGRSICIVEKRKSTNYDDDILLPPPQTASTLTHIEYYEPKGGAGDEVCSFERVTFEEKQTSEKLYEISPPNDAELFAHEVEEGKKWIEMQFQTDSETTAYEYTYERAPLEDIKEEDTDDMQSSKVGSVSSQISQSIGSLGSMKQSLSSTPDYDILAGKRYFSKSAEPDTISQGSLQEFERLEQLMALESMKGKLSASQDSISSGSNEKKCSIAGDDVSVSSLKEFEGLELACGEMDKIEQRAKAEECCLSQIEEGHESQASESESCETLEKSCYESDVDEDDYDKKMFEIDEIIRQAQSNVEKFVDRLEKTESLGRGDSFEETARIPELDFDHPAGNSSSAAVQRSSSDLYSGKKYIENVDLSHSLTESTDSLELKPGSITSKYLDDPVTSTDSLEGGASSEGKSKLEITSDSLDNRAESPRSEATELLVHDEYDSSSSMCRLSPNQINSPDSADATSSTATHATYQNDSIMSSSLTSVDSNTMVSSTENLEHVVSNYSSWLEGGQQATTVATTRHAESSSEGYESIVSTTRHTVEMPVEVEGVKVVYKGPQAKKMLEQEIASFKPGEYVTETREVDAEGKVRVRRVIETRTVLTSEQVESGHTTLKFSRSNDDASGGSASCSKVTTTILQSNLTLAGPASGIILNSNRLPFTQLCNELWKYNIMPALN